VNDSFAFVEDRIAAGLSCGFLCTHTVDMSLKNNVYRKTQIFGRKYAPTMSVTDHGRQALGNS
jgi:hypothetical protein